MADVIQIEQRWLNSKQAATYCGYESADHFRKTAQESQVPKHGPKSNRYDRYDLDAWMENPRCFLTPSLQAGRRRAGACTPVSNILHEIVQERKQNAQVTLDDKGTRE